MELWQSKAPGPDGYNFLFIKNAWEILKDDFSTVIAEFHRSGHIPQGANSSFISLISKVKDSCEVINFQPISLINCVYKVIAKLLANRLKRVLSSIISPSQTGFMEGRRITDTVLIASEVVYRLKKEKRRGWLLKIDFQKAYHSVNW